MSGEFDNFYQQEVEPEIPETPIEPSSEHEKEDKELEEALGHIWDIAEENHLDPFATKFEVAPPHIINQLGAYGIPGRYSHWTYGRSYREMKTKYDYGLSKIYELVINSDPSQAYLLENNPPIDNKFVMAHVLGHTDFFKNNRWFADTRRDMPKTAALSAERIKAYEEVEGQEEVEKFLDAALAIEEHIDPYMLNRPGRETEIEQWQAAERKRQERTRKNADLQRNDWERQSEEPDETSRQLGRIALNIPPEPDKDLVGFIRNHAPYLEDWQRDILDVVRSQAEYFHPQRRTKIMNEGWAAYWHKRIMREMSDRSHITPAEDEAWWKVHSGVVAHNPENLNPYYVGMKIFEYIEDYHNGNLTAKEERWLRSQEVEVPPHFDGQLKDSPAAPILREAMMYNDDQSFIRNHLDKNVADRLGMYAYETQTNPDGEEVKVIKDTGWEEIRDQLVAMLGNAGTPYINVINGDHAKAGQLHLRHEFDGRSLDPGYIEKTLPYIHDLWQRPVLLETVEVDKEEETAKRIVYTYDGEKVSKLDI